MAFSMRCVFLAAAAGLFILFAVAEAANIKQLDEGEAELREQDHDPAHFRQKRLAATTATLISTAVLAGSSLIGTTTAGLMAGTGYSVQVGIEVENLSKYHLIRPFAHPTYGYVSTPPVEIEPGEKETMVGHKSPGRTSGTTGTAAWFVNGHSTCPYDLTIMWSVPYHRIRANYLAVGFRRPSESRDYYSTMYYGEEYFFAREQFHYNTQVIRYCVERCGICVKGTMGNNFKPKVFVTVYPKSYNDLASNIQEAVGKEAYEEWARVV